MRESKRERERVRERERERGRKREGERERERKRESEREKERGRKREEERKKERKKERKNWTHTSPRLCGNAISAKVLVSRASHFAWSAGETFTPCRHANKRTEKSIPLRTSKRPSRGSLPT